MRVRIVLSDVYVIGPLPFSKNFHSSGLGRISLYKTLHSCVCVCVFEIFPNITWMLSFDAALRHIDNTNFVWNWFDSIFNLFRSNTLISTCQSNARDLVPFLVSILHSTRHKMNRKCGRRNKTRFVV